MPSVACTYDGACGNSCTARASERSGEPNMLCNPVRGREEQSKRCYIATRRYAGKGGGIIYATVFQPFVSSMIIPYEKSLILTCHPGDRKISINMFYYSIQHHIYFVVIKKLQKKMIFF